MKLRRNYAQLVAVAVTVLAPLIANASTKLLGSTLKRFNAMPRSERKKSIREALSTWKAQAILGPNATVARQVIKSDVAFEALLDTLESFSDDATKAGGEIAHAAAREAIAQTAIKKNPTVERGRVFRLGAAEGKERARMTREAYTRSRGVAKAGTPDYFAGIRSPKRKEMTETAIYFVPATQDPDGEGYFLLVYDPRRTLSIQRITQKVGGWQQVPSVTHVQLESLVELSVSRGGKIQRTAPSVHRVISLGQGLHAVVGRRAKERDIFEDRREAEKHAKDLDVKAASQLIPEVHSIVKTATGTYRVDGPRADDVDFDEKITPRDVRLRKAQSEKDWESYNRRKEAAPSGVKVPFEMTKAQEIVKEWSYRGPFETKEDAERAAKNLDRIEATSGATPIAAKRTKVNASFDRANAKAQETIAAFYGDEIPLRVMWEKPPEAPTSARRKPARISSEAAQIYMERRAPAAPVVRAKPSQFHGIPYRTLREALAEEDFTEDEIDEIILEERQNRALVEEQQRREMERKLELEAQRAGRLPRRRTAARKEIE